MSRSGLGANTNGLVDRSVPLFAAYRTGLWDVVDATLAHGRDPAEILEALVDYYTRWLQQDTWPDLWAFLAAAAKPHPYGASPATNGAATNDALRLAAVYRDEERLLLECLAVAAGASDPVALARGSQVVIDGSAIAAVLDGERAAAEDLRALLTAVWRQYTPVVEGGSVGR